jgi:hypothetical protein
MLMEYVIIDWKNKQCLCDTFTHCPIRLQQERTSFNFVRNGQEFVKTVVFITKVDVI